jgi:CheY-like chemotaxis protein/MinD-like ATPase involved in chromosome partitioning or flagellar assembly
MTDKILIVDDDADTVKFIALMLNKLGYQVVSAMNGVQALEMAHSEHPDLIILDVMMPGLDGFEVARSLRRHPETAVTPILMFTAKAKLDDKITGYNAGVNIYLTKPIHPVELQANIKTLLVQRQAQVETAAKKGYVVGVLAAKGGLGVSTVALNLAMIYHMKNNVKVIAAELRPGQGTWAIDLNLTSSSGLAILLSKDVTDITQTAVNEQLMPTFQGVRLLLASNASKDVELATAVAQLEATVQQLSQLADLVVLDIGTNFQPAFNPITDLCNEIILVTEPQPAAVKRTQIQAKELGERGFGRSKPLNIITMNRTRSDLMLSVSQVEQLVGRPVELGFPPANELAYRAAEQSVPITSLQPEGVIAQQFHLLADQLKQRISSA